MKNVFQANEPNKQEDIAIEIPDIINLKQTLIRREGSTLDAQ